jgi:alpha-D-ribose 1-methylphosphonate 5-triphosphate diphosphatase
MIIYNGKIVTEKGVEKGKALVIQDDLIDKIISEDEIEAYDQEYKRVDAKGAYITPGFIDIHSDYIEQVISPRSTTMMDFHMGIKESEKALISHGVTTMYHSLSLHQNDPILTKPIRRSANVIKLIEQLYDLKDEDHLIRNRVHARLEIDNVSYVEEVIKLLEQGKIHLLSFMDHTPGQGQYRDLEVYRKTYKGHGDVDEESFEKMVKTNLEKEKFTMETILEISKIARANQVSIASHDDDSFEKVALAHSFGTTISEFPITLDVAREATNRGLWTVVGAPNILLGGSHSGNLSALEAIQERVGSILCSDYYPQAFVHAIFQLAKAKVLPLYEAFKLATLHPAQALEIDEEYGSIKEGKKADLLIVEDGEHPAVKWAMVDGREVYAIHYR